MPATATDEKPRSTGSPYDSDEQEIRELVATWMSATKAGDIETVLSLMTDDVVFLVAGQQPFGKQQFAAAMKPPATAHRMPLIDGHSEIQEITDFRRSRLHVGAASRRSHTARRRDSEARRPYIVRVAQGGRPLAARARRQPALTREHLT